MRRFAVRLPPPLKPSNEIEQIAQFSRLAYVPSAAGPQCVMLDETRVFFQSMEFRDLDDGSRRRAPPLLIGPAQSNPFAKAMLATFALRLTAIAAIDAIAGDHDAPNAILKGTVSAIMFGIEISDSAESDFAYWRQCRRDLCAWHQLAFARPTKRTRLRSMPWDADTRGQSR